MQSIKSISSSVHTCLLICNIKCEYQPLFTTPLRSSLPATVCSANSLSHLAICVYVRHMHRHLPIRLSRILPWLHCATRTEQCQWGGGTTIAHPATDGGCLQNHVSNRAVNTHTHLCLATGKASQNCCYRLCCLLRSVAFYRHTHTHTKLSPTMRCLEKRTAQAVGEAVGNGMGGRPGQIKKCVSNFLAAITFH